MSGGSTAGAGPATRIAIVEDDTVISDQMREAFEEAGFAVSEVRSGDELKVLLAGGGVHMVTLDLDLGQGNDDGIDLARDIRRNSDVPFIVVTGSRKKLHRIVSLELGADDVIAKPFDLDELIARVRAILRRVRRAASTIEPREAAPTGGVVRFEGWRFDVAGHRVWAPSGKPVALTGAESTLLAILVGSARVRLARQEIRSKLRGADDTADERAIDVIIGRLRRKLEPHAEGIELIKTLRGEGYLFCVEVQPEKQ